MEQKSMHSGGPQRAREGSTIVIVALLMAAVATLSLSFLAVLRSSQQESQGSRESLSALYACEAGLTAAVESLVQGGSGTLGTKNNPVEYGGQSYWVAATPIGDGRTSLLAYGRDDAARMGVEMVVQQTADGFFRWAAFGDEFVHMDAAARTDSYDSSAGTYDSQTSGSGLDEHADTEGDIGTNGSISLDSNNKVWGDASPGPSGTVTGDLSNITGSTTPLPATIELPDIVLPVIAQTSDLTVSSDQTLASGSYGFTALQVNTGRTLTINGPATILCNDFKLKSNSAIVVNAADGPVEFFVVNDFVLNSNTEIASTTQSPLDIEFNLLSDNILDPGVDVSFDEDLVDFDSGSKLYGTIFAPDAEITIDSNFELFGALVARRVDLDSNCRIHYDEILATASEDGDPAYQALSWRIVSQP